MADGLATLRSASFISFPYHSEKGSWVSRWFSQESWLEEWGSESLIPSSPGLATIYLFVS